MYKNIKNVLVFWFVIYLSIFSLIIWVPSLIKIVDYYKKNDFSTKIDIKFLSTTLQTSLINIFLVLIIIINFAVLNIYLIPQSLNKKNIDNNHIQPICVIAIYIFICYLLLTVLKHWSGRPFYMNVAWTRNSSFQSHLNPDLSIETYFKNKNWNFFNSDGIGKFSEAKYYEWWQANNTIKNWINWFNLPEKVWINYNDHYQDMDFPSGHIFSYTALFSTVYIFYFSSNYKLNKKFNILQKSYFAISFILVIICAIGLMIQMFHWPSDISFSLAMSTVLFLFSIYLFKLMVNKNNLNRLIF